MDKLRLRESTLRYLRTPDDALSEEENRRLDDAIDDVLREAEPRTVHRIFPLIGTEGARTIDARIDLGHKDLQDHLKNCQEVLLIAGTLGTALDTRLRYMSYTDMAKYVMMDAASGALIELSCDQTEEALPIERATFRYSPGYGDVPLSMQREILSVLEAGKRIGLTTTERFLLVPSKSITGFVGIGATKKKRSCEGCRMFETCEFRRNHTVCYQTNS